MEKMLIVSSIHSSTFLEKNEQFNISDLIKDIIIKYNRKYYNEYFNNIFVNGKNLIRRCMNNSIDNAIKYGNKVNIELKKNNNNLFIILEDNGPGIPENEYENVLNIL